MNEDKTIRQDSIASDDEEVIDLGRLLFDMNNGLRRFWAFGLALVISFAIVAFAYQKMKWTPRYDAFASMVVSGGISSSAQTSSDASSAKQMGAVFPYIVTSGVLRSVIAKELGPFSSGITASTVSNTNLLTIHVYDQDPQMAYDVLQAVLKNYPSVAEYVIGTTRFNVLDESGVPEAPYNTTSYYKSVVMAGMAGLVLFLGFLVIYALSRKTAISPVDLRQEIGLNFLTNVPMQNIRKRSGKSGSLRVDKNHTSSEFVEAFRTLANRVEKYNLGDAKQQKKVLVVTSTAAGEGKSTVALNLAILFAHRGKKVILIDADLRKPSLASVLNAKNVDGDLVKLLQGQGTLKDALVRYHRLPMQILYAGDAGEDTIKLLNSESMREVLRQCRMQADYVIVDTAPIGVVADAASLISSADATVFVVKQDYAQMSDISNTVTMLREMETPIVGFVLNGTVKGGGNYGYGYGYGYGRGYGYGSYGYGKYSSGYASYAAYSKTDGLKVDYTDKELVGLDKSAYTDAQPAEPSQTDAVEQNKTETSNR